MLIAKESVPGEPIFRWICTSVYNFLSLASNFRTKIKKLSSLAAMVTSGLRWTTSTALGRAVIHAPRRKYWRKNLRKEKLCLRDALLAKRERER